VIKEKITRAVFHALDILNEQLPPEKRLAKTLDTVLWGPEGGLDSLGLANLIVAVEDDIAEQCHVTITLTNYTVRSEPTIHFATVGTLVNYVGCLLEKTSK
jgi:acyl carrier protein